MSTLNVQELLKPVELVPREPVRVTVEFFTPPVEVTCEAGTHISRLRVAGDWTKRVTFWLFGLLIVVRSAYNLGDWSGENLPRDPRGS
jgi:hypothetical protein